MDRLWDELELKALALPFEERFGDTRLSGEEQDFCGGKHFEDGDGELNSVHARHEDVGEQVVGMEALGHFERGPAVIGGHDVKVGASEDFAHGVGDEPLVVDDEDLAAAGLRVGGRTGSGSKFDDVAKGLLGRKDGAGQSAKHGQSWCHFKAAEAVADAGTAKGMKMVTVVPLVPGSVLLAMEI